MLDLSPLALATQQLATDRLQTKRFPDLLARKIARMGLSPLAFLRGAAPLFYSILQARPELAEGPDGAGWIAGDLHLENFGAYRADEHTFSGGAKDAIVFGLNDFDEGVIAPFRLEVLRLTTSLILAAHSAGASGDVTLDLCDALLAAYVKASRRGAALPTMPSSIKTLLDQVKVRTREELLDARTDLVRGKRRFQRGDRYRDLPDAVARAAPKAFAAYVAGLPKEECPSLDHLEVIDVALRVAGTGSLGCLRIAVLVKGKGGGDGAWIFDMKEEAKTPSASIVRGVVAGAYEPAERVMVAMHACLEHPPRLSGTTKLGGTSMFVRRLAPQEDKLDFFAVRRDETELSRLAAFLGGVTGAAHARSVTAPAKKPWSAADCEALVGRAIEVAQIHEGAYLAYCRLTGQARREKK